MKEKNRREDFEAKISLYLHDLRLIALWLTKESKYSECLIHQTLKKAYKIWHPCISENNFKIMLFQILTDLFFTGIQQKPDSTIPKNGIDCGTKISYNRLSLINNDYRIIARRIIVRSPVEVQFVKILSKIGRFSNLEIAKIIGIKEDKIKLHSFGGSRFLRDRLFFYGEG